MKKQLLFLSFALLFFMGNQHVDAQERVSTANTIENVSDSKAIANKKVKSLTRRLGLEKNQQEKLYEIFVNADQKMKGVHAIDDVQERTEKTKTLNDMVHIQIKELLSEDQYETYLVVSQKW